VCRALLSVYTALLRVYRALLSVYTALLRVYRALLSVYTVHLRGCFWFCSLPYALPTASL